ncbi:MAG: molybdopterin-guanine dinucleotide biosynthesis protein A [Alphaproteobacteria bacterium]|nr:molybdopterin-guanine dinucleotide biosynthesis protein A [Alphaproteobacteria bacterium]
MLLRILLTALLFCSILAVQQSAFAQEHHAGYYYPPISSEETYRARAAVMGDTSRRMRIGFVVAQTLAQQQQKYAPRFAIFAKGDEAEKMIILGLDEDSFATLYRARAMLAQMTASARASALFRNLAVDDLFTFFDLAKMLGFTQITVSDGKTYAHRIELR